MKLQRTQLSLALLNATLLSIAGCGGGSSSDISALNAPASAMTTIHGTVVVDQAVRNAVVCMDLNANSVCDADEPTSDKTGADGAYSLTYDTTLVTTAQVAAASLIAPLVPSAAHPTVKAARMLDEPPIIPIGPGAPSDDNTTFDAAQPTVGNTARAYVLKQVPGQSGQINPLTTLVAAGVAGGMTEAVARANVAVQLGIAPAKIDNYQDDPAYNSAQVQDNARSMAKITAAALEAGVALQVGDQNAAVDASPGDLASFIFGDASNYYFRTLDVLSKPAGTSVGLYADTRAGKTSGTATAKNVLYNQAYLTASGWVRCDDTVANTSTRGTPHRSTFCNASNSVGFFVPSDISGQTMGSVVTTLQTDSVSNVINNGVATTGLLAALGATTYPPGSAIRARTGLNLTQPIFINSLNTDGRPQSEATTLEQLIAAKPSSGVKLATASGSLSLGLSSGELKNLRVAFTGATSPIAGTVQFYDCDLNSAQTVPSNCVAAQTGTYTISIVGGKRVMRFAGHPETVMNHTRLYVEVTDAPSVIGGNWVFQAREMKPSAAANQSSPKRLNPTAWAAMKTQLGI